MSDFKWQPINTCPPDTPVILANFKEACLLTGSPHTWTSMYVTEWCDLDGTPCDDVAPLWCEASYGATNQNGTPTHLMPLPEPPSNEN